MNVATAIFVCSMTPYLVNEALKDVQIRGKSPLGCLIYTYILGLVDMLFIAAAYDANFNK